jgi:hypothetical protein
VNSNPQWLEISEKLQASSFVGAAVASSADSSFRNVKGESSST